MALNDEQQATMQLTTLCMYNEVLGLHRVLLVCCPAISTDIETQILLQILMPGLVAAPGLNNY